MSREQECRHLNVPGIVFVGLVAAPSKGSFYGRHVKGRYRSERVDEQPAVAAAVSR